MLLAVLLAAAAFDLTASSVGPNFQGDDFEALYRSLAVEPKGEFETTAQFEARKKAPPPAVYAFVAPKPDPQYNVRYDADAGAFTIDFTREEAHGSYGSFIDSFIPVIDRIDASRFYDASNAFGVGVKVYERTIGRWGIVVPDEPQRYLKLSVPVPPERAPALKERLSTLIVIRTNAESRPLVRSKDKLDTGTDHEKPTIKRPQETRINEYGLEADLLGVWIYDRETGDVLAKFDAVGQRIRADGTIEFFPAETGHDVIRRVRVGSTADEMREAAKPLVPQVRKKRGNREEWTIGGLVFELAEGRLAAARYKSSGEAIALRQ